MEKRAWSTPVANVEQFLADEYVNACWSIRCELPFGNGYDGIKDGYNENDYGGHQDEDGTCGSYTSHYIVSAGNDQYRIMEDSSYLGDLWGQFYTPDNDPNTKDEFYDTNDSDDLTGTWSNYITLNEQQLKDTATNPLKVFWRTTYTQQSLFGSITRSYYHWGFVKLIDGLRAKHS